MNLLRSTSFWTENKTWIITAAGAAVAVTAGILGRRKIAQGVKQLRSSEDTDNSHSNGNRLTSALRWSAITGAAAGVGKLLSRDKSQVEIDSANVKISADEPVPEPVNIRKVG